MGYLDGLQQPNVPCRKKSDSIAKPQPGPFVEAAFQRHQAIQVSDDESVRHEEEKNRKQPQNYMSVARFHGRPIELRDDDDEDLGEYQVDDAEFAAERSTVGLDFGFGCFQGRIVGGGHVQCLDKQIKKPRSIPPKNGRIERGTLVLFSYFFSAGFSNKS